MSSTSYNIHLYPSVYLKNFLPIDIAICLPGITDEKVVEASKILQISTIEPGRSSIVIKVIRCFSCVKYTHFFHQYIFISDIFLCSCILFQYPYLLYNSCRSIWRRIGLVELKFKEIHQSFQYVRLNHSTVHKKSLWTWECIHPSSMVQSSWHYTAPSGC